MGAPAVPQKPGPESTACPDHDLSETMTSGFSTKTGLDPEARKRRISLLEKFCKHFQEAEKQPTSLPKRKLPEMGRGEMLVLC